MCMILNPNVLGTYMDNNVGPVHCLYDHSKNMTMKNEW